ncbi:MAG: LemA family protein [Chloroflexi bacterium]|nr:LemA family protein [Chloroflexota bacterium]
MEYLIPGLIVLAVLWFIFTYNSLVQARGQVKNAWSQIDVQLKRRHDLIPNLVESVRGAMGHERGTLEAVIAARNSAVGAHGVREVGAAEGELTRALGRLFALAEAYPQLRATENVSALQEEVASTENRIGFARQHYNDRVTLLNVMIESLPSNLVASLGGFRPAELFEIEVSAERDVPRVSFS